MPPAETITVALSPESMRVLRASVEAGEHATLGQAVDAAVRAWQREHLDAIRGRIRRSLDDPGPSYTPDEIDAYLDDLFEQTRREQERQERGRQEQGPQDRRRA